MLANTLVTIRECCYRCSSRCLLQVRSPGDYQELTCILHSCGAIPSIHAAAVGCPQYLLGYSREPSLVEIRHEERSR